MPPIVNRLLVCESNMEGLVPKTSLHEQAVSISEKCKYAAFIKQKFAKDQCHVIPQVLDINLPGSLSIV